MRITKSSKSKPRAADPSAHTRVIEGLVLSGVAGEAKFSISPGTAIFADNYSQPAETIERTVSFAGGSFPLPALLSTQTSAYVYLDNTGALGYSQIAPDIEALHEKLWLGYLSSTDGGQSLSGAGITLVDSSDATLLALSVGAINVDSTTLKPIPGGLQASLPRTRLYVVGRNYGGSAAERKLPNLSVVEAKAIALFSYLDRSGSIISLRQPALNLGIWDNNGTIEAVPSGGVTVQRVFLGADGGLAVLPGQQVFSSLGELITAQNKAQTERPAVLNGFIAIACIIARGDAIDVGDASKVAILPADRFGQTGGLVADVFEPSGNTGGNAGSAGIRQLTFSNRVYLRRNQIASFSSTHGVSNSNMNRSLGLSLSSLDNLLIRGFPINRAANVTELRLHLGANSSSAELRFEPIVICRRADGTTDTAVLPLQQPQATRYAVRLAIENFQVAAGDLLSVGFRRTSSGGSSTYYLYLDGAFTLEPI